MRAPARTPAAPKGRPHARSLPLARPHPHPYPLLCFAVVLVVGGRRCACVLRGYARVLAHVFMYIPPASAFGLGYCAASGGDTHYVDGSALREGACYINTERNV